MTRKKIIEYFIKWFIYDLKQSNNNDTYIENVENDLLNFLEPYIDDKHYNFSPFKNIDKNKTRRK